MRCPLFEEQVQVLRHIFHEWKVQASCESSHPITSFLHPIVCRKKEVLWRCERVEGGEFICERYGRKNRQDGNGRWFLSWMLLLVPSCSIIKRREEENEYHLDILGRFRSLPLRLLPFSQPSSTIPSYVFSFPSFWWIENPGLVSCEGEKESLCAISA